MTADMPPQQAAQVPMVPVGLPEIYTTLLEVRDVVRDMQKELGELAHDSSDHEQRLRAIEAANVVAQQKAIDELQGDVKKFSSTVYKLLGGIAVVAPVAGFILSRIFGA